MEPRFNSLERPDRYDDRLETERDSHAASIAASGVPLRPLDSFESWYYRLTVAESIRYVDGDSAIRRLTDSAGHFIFPWRNQ
jgi:hypothetical protein